MDRDVVMRGLAEETMSGLLARFGFLFSDLVILRRALVHLQQTRMAGGGGGSPPVEPSFRVESRVGSQTPEWDVQEQRGANTTLEEVKSGPVDADDRRTLWRRI